MNFAYSINSSNTAPVVQWVFGCLAVTAMRDHLTTTIDEGGRGSSG